MRTLLGFNDKFAELSLRFVYGTQWMIATTGFINCLLVYPVLKRTKGKLPLIPFVLKRYFRILPTLGI